MQVESVESGEERENLWKRRRKKDSHTLSSLIVGVSRAISAFTLTCATYMPA